MLTAKQAREQTDIVSEMLTLKIREQIESIIKQVEGHVRCGFYRVLVFNDLDYGAIEFLKRRLGYQVTKAQSGGFIISW